MNVAHAGAYKAGIIHRDISASNLLICKDDDGKLYGLLNDWELAASVGDGSPENPHPRCAVSLLVNADLQF